MMRFPIGLYGWLIIPLVLMVLALVGLLASRQPAAETEAVAQAEGLCNLPITETETVNSTENEIIIMRKHEIPPIDTAAPDHTETATFSLG